MRSLPHAFADSRRAAAAAVCAILAASLVLTGAFAAVAGAQGRADKALGQPSTASSVERPRFGSGCPTETACLPGLANDGRADTRWASEYSEDEWWQVDLGRARAVDSLVITFEGAYAERYRISTSLDGRAFATAAEPELRVSDAEKARIPSLAPIDRRFTQTTTFPVRSARFVRITSIRRAQPAYGVSIWEVGVFGPADDIATALAPPAPAPAPAPAPPAPAPVPLPAPVTAPAPPVPAAPAPAPGARPLKPLTPLPVVRIKGTLTARGARISLLTVRAPAGSQVRVRCLGRSCPRRIRGAGKRLMRFRTLERSLRAGTVIQVYVTKPGTTGRFTRLEIRRNSAPRRSTACVLPGTRKAVRCPST